MTKKQVFFWRFILISILLLSGYFTAQKVLRPKNKTINQVIEVKKIPENIKINKNDEKIIEKEVELSIRPDDFYKEKK